MGTSLLRFPDDSQQAAVATAEEPPHMLYDILDVLRDPEAYVCIWRDGELHIEPVEPSSADYPIAA